MIFLMPMGSAKMSLVIVSKKEFREVQSELHTNPVDHCCLETVVPCSTMARNMVDRRLSNGWRASVSQVCFERVWWGPGCYQTQSMLYQRVQKSPLLTTLRHILFLCKNLKLNDIFVCHGLKNLSDTTLNYILF